MKRSQAVLAVIAAATVGGTAYSMMGPENCATPSGSAVVNPPNAGTSCRSGGGSGGYHGSRSVFGSSGHGDSASAAPSAASDTQRGGFGGFFRSLGHIALGG
jgi:hypothetical protein